MELTDKILVAISPEDRAKLQALANANTSGNMSELVRSLVRRASLLPGEFGLLPPVEIDAGKMIAPAM